MKKYLMYACTLMILITYVNSCHPCLKCQEKRIDKSLLDSDNDNLTDLLEEEIGTDPFNADTDGDGLQDGAEYYTHKTNPLLSDTDVDGLTDGEEILSYNTDALNPDTDGDQLKDGEEIKEYFTNPFKVDTDDDNLNDYVEVYQLRTDPNNYDTDGDGFADGVEVNEIFSDPLDPRDPPYIEYLANVYFDFDRSNIDEQGENALKENTEKLNSAPRVKLKITGYTDHVGNDWYNLRLSRRRAYAVYEAYKEMGISENRMEYEGSGKAPVPCGYQDYNGKGCRENRRVESMPIHPFRAQLNRN